MTESISDNAKTIKFLSLLTNIVPNILNIYFDIMMPNHQI